MVLFCDHFENSHLRTYSTELYGEPRYKKKIGKDRKRSKKQKLMTSRREVKNHLAQCKANERFFQKWLEILKRHRKKPKYCNTNTTR